MRSPSPAHLKGLSSSTPSPECTVLTGVKNKPRACLLCFPLAAALPTSCFLLHTGFLLHSPVSAPLALAPGSGGAAPVCLHFAVSRGWGGLPRSFVTSSRPVFALSAALFSPPGWASPRSQKDGVFSGTKET